ncbi:hypothetical protein U1Q18_017847, partial [Sarracenia purpurea var. burkii]
LFWLAAPCLLCYICAELVAFKGDTIDVSVAVVLLLRELPSFPLGLFYWSFGASVILESWEVSSCGFCSGFLGVAWLPLLDCVAVAV